LSLKILAKSGCNFLCNPANKQTDKRRVLLYFLVEIIIPSKGINYWQQVEMVGMR